MINLLTHQQYNTTKQTYGPERFVVVTVSSPTLLSATDDCNLVNLFLFSTLDDEEAPTEKSFAADVESMLHYCLIIVVDMILILERCMMWMMPSLLKIIDPKVIVHMKLMWYITSLIFVSLRMYSFTH